MDGHVSPAIIEGGDRHRIYDFTTNKKDFRLFVKCRSARTKIKAKAEDYRSWEFVFSESEIQELQKYCNKEDSGFDLCLICGGNPMRKSQYAVLNQQEIKEFLGRGKPSIT